MCHIGRIFKETNNIIHKEGLYRIQKEILICDFEEEYAKRFAEVLLQKKGAFLQVRSCMSYETAKKLLEISHIQVLLISEEFPYEIRKQLRVEKRIVLTREHCKDLGEEEKELMKYQTAERLTAEVSELCREDFLPSMRAGKRKSMTIGVYSPIHRIGRTTLSVKLGKLLAERENVLYLNLETYAGIGGYFPEEKGQDLSHLLYYVKQEAGDISVQISSMVRQMDALDYISPMKVWTDLRSVTMEEWKKLLERLKNQSIYSVLILDIGSSVSDIPELLESLDLIIVPVLEDIYGQAKLRQYRTMLKMIGKQKLELHSVYIDMNRPIRQAVKQAQEEIERWRGKAVRHDDRTDAS